MITIGGGKVVEVGQANHVEKQHDFSHSSFEMIPGTGRISQKNVNARVDIAELMVAAGKVIANVTGAEDDCPTTGAAAGIAISVAAVIAGTSLTLIEQIPYTQGIRNEIILQKGHSVHFGASISI